MLKHEEQLEHAREEHISSTKDQERLVEIEQNYKNQIDTLSKELEELQKESRDFETLKKQVEQQSEEYHRLAVEKNLLATEPKKTIPVESHTEADPGKNGAEMGCQQTVRG